MSNIVTNEILCGAAANLQRQALVVVISGMAAVCDGLVASLRRLGYRALAVELSADSQTYHGAQPNLIITDCSPELWPAHGMICNPEAARKIPVIFLIDPEHREHREQRTPTALDASMDVLARPFSIGQLEARVRRRLEADRSDDHETPLPALLEQRYEQRRQVGRRRDDGLQVQWREHDRRQGKRRWPAVGQHPGADVRPPGASGALPALPCAPTISVLVASDRRTLINALRSTLTGEQSLRLTGAHIATSEDLRAVVGESAADLVMVDTALIARVGVESLSAMHDVAPGTKLVLVWDDAHPVAVDEIEKRRIRGCIPVDASADLYARAIREVNQGALWLPHWIMAHVLMQRWEKEGAQTSQGEPPNSVALPSLTTREELIARLAANGKTNKEIAKELSVSPDTIKKHLQAVYGKVGVHRRGQLVFCLAVARDTPRD